jgi:hypothetical protein
MRVPRKQGGNGAPITYLWERHKEVARLQVSGMRPIEIARMLGYTSSWLSTIMCSPVYKKYLATLSAKADDNAIDIKKRIQEGAETGVEELLKILKGDGEYKGNVNPSLKAKVAQDFLDRNGNAKVSRIQEERVVTILDAARIEELKQNRTRMLSNLRQPITIEARELQQLQTA